MNPVNTAVGRGFFMLPFIRIHPFSLLRILATASVFCSPLNAQGITQDAPPDSSASARTYALPELVISSARIPSTAQRSPAPVTLIQRSEIEQLGASSLGDVLVTGPGLFLKDYGAASGLKTLSQRGMGTEHTLVLLNGMPINSLQNGSIDFGAFPANEIDRVEVIRGGQSASFGANAVAGVVNILTRTTGPERLSIDVGTGSFGERTGSLAIANAGDNVKYRVGGGMQHTDGDYPFTFWNGQSTYNLTRKNAQIDASRCSGEISARLSSDFRLSATGLYLQSERGVAGVVSSPFSFSRSTQRDQQGILQLAGIRTLSANAWWEAKLHAAYAYQRYADPDVVVGGIPILNNFRSTEGRAEVQGHADMGKWGRYTIGGDAVTASGNGNAVSGGAIRRQFGLFLVTEHRVGFSSDSAVVVSVQPALRFDHIEAIKDVFSPQIGLQVLLVPVQIDDHLQHLLRVHSTAGRNFRTPTFNELYYAGGGGIGNPDLRPERSTTFDLGAGIDFTAAGRHECDVTYYVIEMQDRIIWTTTGTSTTIPKNLRSVTARGIEVTYNGRNLPLGLNASLSYARSSTEKTSSDYPGDANLHTIVPYTPQELLSWNVGWAHRIETGILQECRISVTGARTGFRYTTEDNAEFLPAYTIVNCSFAVDLLWLGVSETLRFDLRNSLNEAYDVMQGYPMPLRAYRLSLSLSY
jgi:vitamin B12 transporter